MTIFNATTQRCLIIDARETAPSGTTEDMFVNTALTSNNGSVFGYRSIATPGELHVSFVKNKKILKNKFYFQIILSKIFASFQ